MSSKSSTTSRSSLSNTISSFYKKLAAKQFINRSVSPELIESIQKHLDVNGIQSYYPGLEIIYDNEIINGLQNNKGLAINTYNYITQLHGNADKLKHYTVYTSTQQPGRQEPGEQKAAGQEPGEQKAAARRTVFCKKVHILNPFEKLTGKYDTDSTTINNIQLPCGNNYYNLYDTLTSQTNQAYIDALVGTILNFLTIHNYSPHFVKIYDVFMGVSNSYKYDITNDYDSLRYHSWFWDLLKDHSLIIYDNSGNIIDNTTILNKPDDDEMESYISLTQSMSTLNTIKTVRSDTIDNSKTIYFNDIDIIETASIKTDDNDNIEDAEDDADSIDNIEDNYKLTFDISNMPVMLIFQESMSGTIDELLDMHEYVDKDIGLTAKQEAMWAAWIFQIIAALIQMQATLHIIHNDLHTNNVMWVPTDNKFIFYKCNNGQKYRVPTYGKIMKIIDFGRATFEWDDNIVFSDDFREGNDADGQYNVDNYSEDSQIPLEPNASFDLARFAISIIGSLYKVQPPSKKKGDIMSTNGARQITETVSPLYNMLWKWMVDDSGESIFEDANGDHPFPGFELYTHIAAHIHNAVPKKQLTTNIFNNYKYSGNIPKDEHAYPLFI
jgi:hypothetical protein